MKIIDLLGRKRQFRRLLEDSQPRLQRMARAWCGDRELAQDLVQEALVRALQGEEQLRALEKFDAWVFKILSNCWYQHLRQLRSTVEFDEDRYPEERSSLEVSQDRADMIERLRYEVGRLPAIQRQAITLVDLEEFSYAETAQILDIPIGTVMSRLHRAREKLCRAMNDVRQEQAAASDAPRVMRRMK